MLQEHIKDGLGALGADGVLRDVHGVEDCVLLEDSS